MRIFLLFTFHCGKVVEKKLVVYVECIIISVNISWSVRVWTWATAKMAIHPLTVNFADFHMLWSLIQFICVITNLLQLLLGYILHFFYFEWEKKSSGRLLLFVTRFFSDEKNLILTENVFLPSKFNFRLLMF